VDQLDGGVGCFVAVAYGVAHRIPIREQDVMDCVPVDTVVNGILASVAATCARNAAPPFRFSCYPHNALHPPKELKQTGVITFWHMGTSGDNRFSTRAVYRQVAHFFRHFPMKKQVRRPWVKFIGDTHKYERVRLVNSSVVNALTRTFPRV
jgi:hypothetical protein